MAETSIINAVGAHEDLSDALVLIEPGDTPIFSMCRKGTEPANPLYSWPVDKYREPDTDGELAGDDVTSFNDEHADRALLYGRIQKVREPFKVDDIVENVSDLAGVGKKQAFNKAAAKAMVQIKTKIEAILGSDNDSQAQSGSSPFKTRGLGSWASSTAQADTATAVPAAYRTPAASIDATATASLTESLVTDVLQSMYGVVKRRRNYDLICGTALKRAFSNFIRTTTGATNVFSSIRTFTQAAESKKIVNVIDIYESDFGSLALHLDSYLAVGSAAAVQAARGYVLDMETVELRFNRKPRMVKLEDQGGGPRGFTDAILGFAATDPRVLGKFAATA
jgi:hypothetical protein